MRLLPTTHCKSGMKLAKSILTEDGVILLRHDVELTERLIRRLIESGIGYVYVRDPMTDDLELPELVSDETRIRAISEVRRTFRGLAGDGLLKGAAPPNIAGPIRDIMNDLIDEMSGRQEAMLLLANIVSTDHYLYQHSVNVCIYTTLLGLAEEYGRDELVTLGMGALLHDIGKTRIPLKLLLKPGALTDVEFDEMKRHTEYGYRMLKDLPNMPLYAAHCAYQHHERLDGSGYPRGIRQDEIIEYAKWIGIADSYDAMTTARVYRGPMLPHEAVEALYAGSGRLYEQRMLERFRDRIVIYPIGLTVKLSTGETGIVSRIGESYAHRPVVRLLTDRDGQPLSSPQEIDLACELSTMIVGQAEVEQTAAAEA